MGNIEEKLKKQQHVLAQEYYKSGLLQGRYDIRYEVSEALGELWDKGVNMTDEYQGVWVRFSDIEKVLTRIIKGEEFNENNNKKTTR